MSTTHASAVMIPESAIATPLDTSNEQNGLKRRQSETSETETENKRQRTGKSPPTTSEEKPSDKTSDSTTRQDSPSTTANGECTQQAATGREERRKSGVADEKQRSKRLFGALLGNLNQPRDRTTKRRAEIEQRRKAELEKQDNERLEDKQRRLAKLAHQRKKEQVFVDEQNMHTRHKNLLHAANMLRTKAEPRLYYRPWDLLSEDEDTIAQQLSDAREQVDKEVADFASEKEERLAAIRKAKETPEEVDKATSPTVAGAEAEVAKTDTNSSAPAESTDPATTTAPMDVAEESKVSDETTVEDAHTETADGDTKIPERQAEMKSETTEDAEKKAAEAEAERVEAEDEGDHVVEGDEDTVIY